MINKGDPINPKQLEDIITSNFSTIFESVTNLIPIGFNSLYNVTGSKTFSIRPKVINPVYSTRSGSDISSLTEDTTQSNIGAAYLGTPWTVNLGSAFGLTNYQLNNLGTIQEPYDKIAPIAVYNPATDIYGGVPLRGNMPLIFRGTLGLSNWFEDQNIRSFVSESGDSLTVKAKQVSLYCPYQEAYDTPVDYMYKEGFRLAKPVADIDISVDTTSLAEGDYLAYLLGTSGTTSIDLDPSDISLEFVEASSLDLSIDYGVAWSGKGAGAYPDGHLVYERPLFIVHSNGTGIETSNVTAWEEIVETNTNSNYKYSKLYQQCSSVDTTINLATSDIDRRMIPAYHYFNNNNDKLISCVSYNGIVRDIPGAGGNKVTLDAGVWDASSIQLSGYIDQCEVTDGTTSLWVKNLPISSENIIYVNGDSLDPYQKRGLYVWLTVSPEHNPEKSISGTSTLVDEGYHFDYRVVLHSSPTWESDPTTNNSGVSKGTYSSSWWKKSNAYRCRIGWIPTATGINITKPIKITDGHHVYSSLDKYDLYLYNYTIGSGGNHPTYEPCSLNQCKVLPVWGNNGLGTITTSTSVACTSIDLELYNYSGTGVTGTSWVGVTTDTISTAAGVDVKTTGALSPNSGNAWLSTNIGGTETYMYRSSHTLSIGTNDTLYYTGTGADGGAYWNQTYKMALVKGFYLPYSWR